MKALERFGGVSILGGVGCYAFALTLLILAPYLNVEGYAEPKVINVDGDLVDVPEYTENEAHGRQVYIEQVCWHCHSQYVRPTNEEYLRFGPVSQPGESVRDVPHLYSTRRTGPDLSREGWLRVDDWHIAHFWDPRTTVRDSPMPAFPWLFTERMDAAKVREMVAMLDSDGDNIVSRKWDDQTHWPKNPELQSIIENLDTRGVDAPTYKQADDGSDQWPTNPDALLDGTEGLMNAYVAGGHDAYNKENFKNTGDGLLSDYDAAPVMTKEGRNLLEYIQQMGKPLGKWRKPIVYGTPLRGPTPLMRGVTATYEGVNPATGAAEEMTISIGDGKMPQRHRGARRYGYHLKNASDAEKRDSENKQKAYDALMAKWRLENPDWDRRLKDGETLYNRHCAACHGDEGRGNGDGAQFMLIRPRDFTRALYRYRSVSGGMPLDGDLYRSLYRGLPGSSMPSWKELNSNELWLLVDYVKSFRESTEDWDHGTPWNDVSAATPMPQVPQISADELPEAPDGAMTELLLRGRAVYNAFTCYSCHGAEGRGDGPGWALGLRENGGALRPRHLRPKDAHDIAALRFRGGAEPQDIWRAMMNGLSGVGMPTVRPAFEAGWKAADELAALEKAGAPAEQIEAARAKARKKLLVPLKDPRMIEAGIVIAETDANGNYAEYLPTVIRSARKRSGRWVVGDDWALVAYVRYLAGEGWPYVRSDD